MIDLFLRAAWAPSSVIGRFGLGVHGALEPRSTPSQGRARAFLPVLAGLAIAYPIAASIAHALGDPTPGGDSLGLALRPGFDVVYSESLPFMVAAVGIGLFSPALGVLFMTVFIPADLIAADLSGELENYAFQDLPPGAAVLGRMASYGLLWILAVEIPIRTREIGRRWAAPLRGGRSTIRMAVAFAVLAGSLTWLWTTAVPLLITPVFTWSGLQRVTRWASDPTWYHGIFIVIAAAAIAAAAALVAPPLVAAGAGRPGGGALPSVAETLIRQTLGALVAALLLLGLASNLQQALLVVGGLLVAGPVLTLVLPIVPVPGRVGPPGPRRWIIAMVVVLGAAAAITMVLGAAMFATDHLPLAALVVGSIVLFRVLAEAGIRPSLQATGAASAASAPLGSAT